MVYGGKSSLIIPRHIHLNYISKTDRIENMKIPQDTQVFYDLRVVQTLKHYFHPNSV